MTLLELSSAWLAWEKILWGCKEPLCQNNSIMQIAIAAAGSYAVTLGARDRTLDCLVGEAQHTRSHSKNLILLWRAVQTVTAIPEQSTRERESPGAQV